MTHQPLKPVPLPLYPTKDSLDAVLALGESKIPITDPNELKALLLTYHNTLLKALSQQQAIH